MQSTHRPNYLCSRDIAFFISASFFISPCYEKQMASIEVAVMCAEGWIDGWDSLSVHTFFAFFFLSAGIHHISAVYAYVHALLWVCNRTQTFVQMYAHAHTSVYVSIFYVSVYVCMCVCTCILAQTKAQPETIGWAGAHAA